MNYLEKYLKTIEVQEIKDSVLDVTKEIFDDKLKILIDDQKSMVFYSVKSKAEKLDKCSA